MHTTFIQASSNVKLGGIPATRTERASCPATCPFYDKGCYAKYGPEQIQWSRMNGAIEWSALMAKVTKLPRKQLWRHNTAGDLPHVNGLIDQTAVSQLVAANRGRRGFTFSHHVLNDHNVRILKDANANGFTINASTESVEVADKVMTEHGIPAVAVIPSTESRRFFKTESGRQVIVCPATIHESVTCATCGLCQVSDRKAIVAFPAHGVAKKTVDAIVTA